jgi:hypothetical protein
MWFKLEFQLWHLNICGCFLGGTIKMHGQYIEYRERNE